VTSVREEPDVADLYLQRSFFTRARANIYIYSTIEGMGAINTESPIDTKKVGGRKWCGKFISIHFNGKRVRSLFYVPIMRVPLTRIIVYIGLYR
jgi:hypothetical protein